MDKLQKFLKNPALLYPFATSRGLTHWMPDAAHLRIMYRILVGNWPDLDHPRTFNEKLQWLKLHDRKPLYGRLVDKYAVKQWVADRIGLDYVTKTYARWDSVEDIDISELPEKFVLKTNHDCGGIAICRDRASFDLEKARTKLAKHLKTNYFWGGREWPYKDVKPCIFAEEYLESNAPRRLSDGSEVDLIDYKFMCFDGEPRCAFTCVGRAKGDLRVDFFDADWRHLPFTRHYPNSDIPPAAPRRLDEMQRLARLLSDKIPFVRVDFYEQGNRVLFGEMTLYPGSGFEEFSPEEWDEILGNWVVLPQKERAKPCERAGGCR